MKIVILYLGRHGAGPMYSYEFCKALLEKKTKILAIISSYCDNLTNWIQLANDYRDDLKLITTPTYNSKSEFIYSSLNLLKYHNIINIIKSYSADYIFTPMVHPWHNVILSFIPKKTKKIKVIHDADVHKGERNIFSLLLNWLDIKISDKLVVLTEYSKSQLKKKVGNKKPIIVIPHAEFNGYGELNPKSLHIQNRIGFFGRINKYKGLNILLESFDIIQERNKKLRLLIAGNGDCSEYEDYFRKNHSVLDLHIRWIEDKEVANLLSMVDIVILPYIEASQSGVIPLAFALGKTVIVTNVGGLSEQVPDNTGFVIPANRPDILAQKIIELYKDPHIILSYGENAKKYANDNLTWESSANKLLENL